MDKLYGDVSVWAAATSATFSARSAAAVDRMYGVACLWADAVGTALRASSIAVGEALGYLSSQVAGLGDKAATTREWLAT